MSLQSLQVREIARAHGIPMEHITAQVTWWEFAQAIARLVNAERDEADKAREAARQTAAEADRNTLRTQFAMHAPSVFNGDPRNMGSDCASRWAYADQMMRGVR